MNEDQKSICRLSKQNVAFRADNLRLRDENRTLRGLLVEIRELMPDWTMKDLKDRIDALIDEKLSQPEGLTDNIIHSARMRIPGA